jgi:hypothetical protein
MKAYLILDGTLLPIDRIAADRPFCSGKHKKQSPCFRLARIAGRSWT